MVLGELPKLLEFIFHALPVENENRKVNMKHLEVLNRFVMPAVFGDITCH